MSFVRPLSRPSRLAAGVSLATAILYGAAAGYGQNSTPASGKVHWQGTVTRADAADLAGMVIELSSGDRHASAVVGAGGRFSFDGLIPGTYHLRTRERDRVEDASAPLVLSERPPAAALNIALDSILTFTMESRECARSGGENLSSDKVSESPLNKRDFGQLLLLAAGTSTDTNGASNYTQQFAINGQRGVEATFAIDSADASDPELGGATFTNFNVGAVQEIQSASGWMPAEIGRGAAGYTNVVTRSGNDALHGSVFEFLRNSALDARNYFDHATPVSPGRIPPFRRNEFGKPTAVQCGWVAGITAASAPTTSVSTRGSGRCSVPRRFSRCQL